MEQKDKSTSAGMNPQDEAALEKELNAMSFDELTDRMDTLLRETLGEENALSETKAAEQIEALLAKTRDPSGIPAPVRVKHFSRNGKRIALLAAALVLLAAVLTLAVSANRRDIKLDKGQVFFEGNDTIRVRFEPEEGDELLSMEEYETALQEFGIPDYKIPNYFYEGERWKAEITNTNKKDAISQISATFTRGDEEFRFVVASTSENDTFYKNTNMKFPGVEYAETVQAGETPVYLFDYGKGTYMLIYFKYNCEFNITAKNTTLETMRAIAQSVT